MAFKHTGKQVHDSVDRNEKLKRSNITSILKGFGLIMLLVVSFWIFGKSLAAELTTSSTSTTVACGGRVANYTYKVPFGNSPWNTPTCNLAPYRNSSAEGAAWGKRLFDYGTAWNASSEYWQARIADQKGHFMTQFGLAGDENDYGAPIYHANASTPKRQFMLCNVETCYPSNLDRNNCWDVTDLTCMAPDTAIPFDPSWRGAGDTDENLLNNANDREMIIIDDTTGYVYELGRIDRGGLTCLGGRSILYALAGKKPETRLCVAGVATIRDKDGKQAKYDTYNQGVFKARGMGIQDAAMIVTPEEVQAGEIRHALTMEAFNTMFGPVCTPAQLKNNDPALGKTCGFAVAPATVVEWGSVTDIIRNNNCSALETTLADFNTKQTFKSLMTMDKLIPEGMRFKITATDVDIANWINSRADLKADPVKAKTARIFAVALRDYGWIVGDTTCYGSGFTIAGAANPDAKAKWANLGIKDASSQTLLDGLFTPTNIIALDPPTNTCIDGTTTKYYCTWISSSYPASATASPAPAPAPTPTPPPAPAPAPAPTPTPPPSTSPTPTPTPPPTTPPVTDVKPKAPTKFTGGLAFGFNPSRFEFHGYIGLSWNAGTAANGIAKYRVLKNNTLLYEGLGNSYNDFAVADGGNYKYQVFTQDKKGFYSDPIVFNARIHDCLFGIFCSLN